MEKEGREGENEPCTGRGRVEGGGGWRVEGGGGREKERTL
jgi:hypothetical protein